jgi:NTP pyrophosphatase (non-canonical NTP hydrolase)
MNPWKPMTRSIDLKHIGKLLEELGECSAAASRCMIQGINEREPTSAKSNQVWLEEEIADVRANLELVIEHFNLDPEFIKERTRRKKAQLKIWHNMLD